MECGHIVSTAATEPLLNTTTDTGSQPPTRKEKPVAKKKKGEAEKLLADRKARPTQRTLARKKEVRLPAVRLLYLLALYTSHIKYL